MKRIAPSALLFACLITLQLSAYEQVAEEKMSFWETKRIVVDKFIDPASPNITCYVSRIHDKNWFEDANPSDSSLTCVKSYDTAAVALEALKNAPDQEVYVHSQSRGDKALRVKRKYDAANNTVLYIAYTNQTGRGSTKHAIAAVNLNH
ncbi:CreA family protein [Endozoicomonas atrinae]|uniref:CreA family protein n=1 Tax=Endozoicomonas atrinae TaxID=1333660 RepID=UPI0008243C5B|nr:CreA family protein [Endozoicomonas atrinae]